MNEQVLLIDIPTYRQKIQSSHRKLLGLIAKAEVLLQRKHIGVFVRGHDMYSRGLLSIASYLERHGIPVKYSVYEQSMTDEELKKKLEGVRVVGITCVTPTIHIALSLCRLIKTFDQQVVCVLGGPHVWFLDKETIENHPEVNVVVRGEGEYAFLDLLHHINELHRVKGVTYRDGCRTLKNEDRLEVEREFPTINYGFLTKPLQSYAHNVMATRGCPNKCSYCVDNRFRGVRSSPTEDIIEELNFLNGSLKKGTVIHFCDSDLLLKKHWSSDLLRKIAQEKFDLAFSCDARPDSVTPELIRKLELANFREINLGFEDLDNTVLECLDKGLKFEVAIQACETVRKNSDLMIKVYMMAGLPGSSRETEYNNSKRLQHLFNQGLIDLVSLRIFVPYPGTKIFHNPRKFGISILTRDWQQYDRFSFPVYRLSALNEHEIYSYFWKLQALVLRNYCKKLGMTLNELASFDVDEESLDYIYQNYVR